MNKIQILDFFKMTNCICGHDVSWHWMDMHKQHRCVFRIAETNACHCKKYVRDNDQEKELTVEHSRRRT